MKEYVFLFSIVKKIYIPVFFFFFCRTKQMFEEKRFQLEFFPTWTHTSIHLSSCTLVVSPSNPKFISLVIRKVSSIKKVRKHLPLLAFVSQQGLAASPSPPCKTFALDPVSTSSVHSSLPSCLLLFIGTISSVCSSLNRKN